MKLQEYWRGNRGGNSKADKLTSALLVVYLIVLIWILLFKLGVQFSYMGKRSVNLIPFGQSLTSNGKIDFSEIILNVIIFVPLGVYAGVLFKRWSFKSRIFFILLIAFLIEVLQYILRVGAFDITDVITNSSGGLIGLIIFEANEKIFHNSVKSQKFINIIGVLGTVVMISLLLLLKLNMLPVRYQ